MIKKIGLFILCMSFLFAIGADSVTGVWFTEGNKSKVEIYREGSEFKGKITWLKEPVYPADHESAGQQKTDHNNPDEALRQRPLVGLNLIWGFRYNENDKRWVDGTIYNPEDGKNYYCSLQIEPDGSLKVRGSLDAWGWVGKTQIWTRPPKPTKMSAQDKLQMETPQMEERGNTP